MRKALSGIVSTAIYFAICTHSAAQVATGNYSYGTFDKKGLDSVNLGNLNVNFLIPILHKSGRGIPFDYSLAYDSSVWFPSTVNGSSVWTPVNLFGWSADTEATTGFVSYWTDTETVPDPGGPPLATCTITTYYSWTYTDPLGTAHAYNGTTQAVSGGDGCPQPTPGFTELAGDGSGYTLTVRLYKKGSVTGASGKAILPAGPLDSSGTVTDSNGNEISVDGNGHFTDTTGNIVLTTAGAAPNSHTFQYSDTNGNPQTVTMNYVTYTVQTAFGCNVGEYGPTSTPLVDSITFPDGSSYHFSYEATPNVPGAVTGRLAGIQLPQGDWISYTYTGGNNGIICSDGSTAGLTRSLSSDSGSASSAWSYARTFPNGAGTSHTEVVDGLGNHLAYDFVAPSNPPSGITADYYEIKRSVYQGSESGTPVVAKYTCINQPVYSSPCPSSGFSLPISTIANYEVLDGIQMRGTSLSLNGYGQVQGTAVYDFGGASNYGATLRSEIIQYPLYYGTMSLLGTDKVYDGAGNLAGQTFYSYDTSAPVASSGVPQHVAVSGGGGNLTNVTKYVSANVSYTSTATYEDTGSLLTATTPNGQTTLSYDPTFVYNIGASLPTPSSGVAINTGMSFDTSNTGLPLSSTDPNSNQTSFAYNDSLLRVTQINNPDGGYTTYNYWNATQEGVFSYQNSGVHTDTELLVDGYGRQSRSAIANGQGTNPWYQVDDCYDANGNLSFQSYRYQGNGWGSGKLCAGSGETYTYDVLGRLTRVTHGDGTFVSFTYRGRAVQVNDEIGVSRIYQVDGLGRSTIVCEISSNGNMPGSGSPVNCGTDISSTGFTTTFGYSLSSHTTTITQGTQTRTFQTDWIGRPILTQEPESGQTTYSYSYNSTGLQVTRTRPEANQTNPSVTTTTTTQYDLLGRVVSVQYSDGTPTKNFAYDQNSGWSAAQNLKGRLSVASVSNAATSYGYDPTGRTNLMAECTPSNCGSWTFNLNYTYDWLGNLLTSGDGAGNTETYTYSQANEVQSITSSVNDSQHPPNLMSNVQNGPFGPLSWQLGNGLTGVRQYDSMGRTAGGWVCQGSSQPGCSGGSELYAFASGWTGAYLTSASDAVLSQSNSYGYDEFGRLTSLTVESGTPGNYSWVYDRWGNRTQESSGANLVFNTSTNQAIGLVYDAAGNVTNDGAHSYTYDAEGNMTQVDGGQTATYTYNALEQRVRTSSPSGALEFIFNPAGQHTSLWDPVHDWINTAWVYWGAARVAFYYAGTTEFDHQDWLGTERMRSNVSAQVAGSFTSLPYGDNYSYSGVDWDAYHFATLDQDDSAHEHAQFRQYSNLTGRWMSPDPYSESYDFTNPQSLNRYVYARDNPLSFTDPTGLNICFFGGPGDTVENDTDPTDFTDDNPADCAAAGGVSYGVDQSVTVNGDDGSDGPLILSFYIVGGSGGAGEGADGAPDSSAQTQRIMDPFVSQENRQFNQCIKDGLVTVLATSEPDGWGAVSAAQDTLKLEKQCLLSFPLAALSPNYSGAFKPGAPFVVGYFSSWF